MEDYFSLLVQRLIPWKEDYSDYQQLMYAKMTSEFIFTRLSEEIFLLVHYR